MKKWLKSAILVFCLHLGLLQHTQAGFWRAESAAPKHVVIDKSQQMLRAYEGNQLVLETRISTGKRGKETPNGHFRAQSKSLMHRSRLYGNVPMPYSVQIAGNYFIHGFSSVPYHPASHGCIRVPMDTAQEFYQWVTPGTPVDIVGGWRS